jgi:hypothetical protein
VVAQIEQDEARMPQQQPSLKGAEMSRTALSLLLAFSSVLAFGSVFLRQAEALSAQWAM